jgi:predicted helicase
LWPGQYTLRAVAAMGPNPTGLVVSVRHAPSKAFDVTTTLDEIPAEAWDYRFGHGCGLERMLGQWKEHRIGDPTVAAKFNIYRFADYKEAVIVLLARVCTVSVETIRIICARP